MDETDLYDDLSDEIDAIITGYKAATSDGRLTFHDGLLLAMKASHRFHRLARSHAEASKDDRRNLVLRAVDRFCVDVLNPLDIPGVPEFVESSVIDPALNAVAHKLAVAGFDFFEGLAAEAAN